MKKIIYIYIFVINWSNFCLCQTISIQNSKTKEAIPYVNISLENEEGSFTSDEKGLFEIPKKKISKRLIFNAIGYEQFKIDIDKIGETIFLVPNFIILDEVAIFKQNRKINKIGSTKNKGIYCIHDITDNEYKPCIIAKYFDFNSNNDNIVLKSIKIKTSSSSLKPLINFRIYSKGKDDKPAEVLYNDNLFCNVNKGENTTKMDVSTLGIVLPNDGFFVAVEILVIDKNKQENKYVYNNVEHIHKFYYPRIKMSQTNEYSDTWYNTGGNWKKNNNLSMLMELEIEE